MPKWIVYSCVDCGQEHTSPYELRTVYRCIGCSLIRGEKRNKAHQAVYDAVRSGKLPHVSTLICQHCKKQPASQYHHYNGYEKNSRLDVEAVCGSCHAKTWAGVKIDNPPRYQKCKALSKRKGKRCPNWAMKDSDYCGAHSTQAKDVKDFAA